ncbi:MAG: tRNA uridine-5-carboxymethylaminomethyl(34) synthesis GTPase MnmE [Alphaproteobacteria bacterium]|nr:tRNA uridine-5-carboxymethylaminomethyl(34) synthesis GTPase MnmE [Alphaproteobacteria bacterium]MDE2109648.1 tRNA uridine-5-carboxymethylaminomethyl(34) synthesis GTPase MnmE [Alphaproteobacteria bacterium]MDE2492349.1 tRNA uridine-5-carboxymethylaminomethyl(34) synthesis GTPase MnmE [Alphaproteobacteria bacterium]
MGETIFALASAAGRAGVAVVRVSGPGAGDCIKHLTKKGIPAARRAVLRALYGADGAVIDQAVVLWFAAPHSLTGEDVAEFQVHGGRAIIEALAAALSALPGCRPAEGGEFTRRAVLNGKLDLTQAEAIADLVAAETEAQRRQALRQYDGALSTLYESWRTELLKTLAWAEASIDFSDEELPEGMLADMRHAAEAVRQAIGAHLNDARRGELVREGLFLTVIGPPNAGKSSLVNALAGRDVAIVSETAGTTRDVIEVRLDLGGYAVILADTAGLRAAAEAVEAEGVRRALARAEAADLVLLLLDGSDASFADFLPKDMVKKSLLTVWNKADLPWPSRRDGLALSLKTGEGLEAVIAAIAAKAKERLESAGDAPMLTRPRHRQALAEAVDALGRAMAAQEPELFAEDLRLALRSIGRITGRVDVEDLLDVIFRDFCIGK